MLAGVCSYSHRNGPRGRLGPLPFQPAPDLRPPVWYAHRVARPRCQASSRGHDLPSCTGMESMGDEPPRRTLAARLEERDRSRFTGRAAQMAFLDQCLDADDPPASVVHICGPGGIGKSTLLREAARHARDRGISVIAIDGRELGPAPGALEAALRPAS